MAVSANRLELLQIAAAVAREKVIDREIVLAAMADAIQKAARSRYGQETNIRADINPTTGEMKLQRLMEVVDTVEDYGRQIAISSARERNERAAELLLKGFSGAAQPSGQTVLTLANSPGATPVDMRASICGKDAKAYTAAQQAAFPMGLKGQPSYLNDSIAPSSYVATDLGRVAVGVTLPRPRPPHVPVFVAPVQAVGLSEDLSGGLADVGGGNVPVPRPRPLFSQ